MADFSVPLLANATYRVVVSLVRASITVVAYDQSIRDLIPVA